MCTAAAEKKEGMAGKIIKLWVSLLALSLTLEEQVRQSAKRIHVSKGNNHQSRANGDRRDEDNEKSRLKMCG